MANKMAPYLKEITNLVPTWVSIAYLSIISLLKGQYVPFPPNSSDFSLEIVDSLSSSEVLEKSRFIVAWLAFCILLVFSIVTTVYQARARVVEDRDRANRGKLWKSQHTHDLSRVTLDAVATGVAFIAFAYSQGEPFQSTQTYVSGARWNSDVAAAVVIISYFLLALLGVVNTKSNNKSGSTNDNLLAAFSSLDRVPKDFPELVQKLKTDNLLSELAAWKGPWCAGPSDVRRKRYETAVLDEMIGLANVEKLDGPLLSLVLSRLSSEQRSHLTDKQWAQLDTLGDAAALEAKHIAKLAPECLETCLLQLLPDQLAAITAKQWRHLPSDLPVRDLTRKQVLGLTRSACFAEAAHLLEPEHFRSLSQAALETLLDSKPSNVARLSREQLDSLNANPAVAGLSAEQLDRLNSIEPITQALPTTTTNKAAAPAPPSKSKAGGADRNGVSSSEDQPKKPLSKRSKKTSRKTST